jgi:phosphonate transport system permease protein
MVVLSLFAVDWGEPILHARGLPALAEIASAALRPNLSPEIVRAAAGASVETIAYATTGVTLAILLAFPAGIMASGVLQVQRRPLARSMVSGGTRAGLAFLRAIHELIWAWLFVAAIGLSPAAAILALALPYAGILGKIFADMLQDVPPAPLAALRATGASETKILLYGRLPAALPNMVSYGLYRYECGLRSAAILSFVGLGGLGYQIQISLADLRFDEVWTFVYVLVLLVVIVDLWSAAVRRRMVS